MSGAGGVSYNNAGTTSTMQAPILVADLPDATIGVKSGSSAYTGSAVASSLVNTVTYTLGGSGSTVPGVTATVSTINPSGWNQGVAGTYTVCAGATGTLSAPTTQLSPVHYALSTTTATWTITGGPTSGGPTSSGSSTGSNTSGSTTTTNSSTSSSPTTTNTEQEVVPELQTVEPLMVTPALSIPSTGTAPAPSAVSPVGSATTLDVASGGSWSLGYSLPTTPVNMTADLVSAEPVETGVTLAPAGSGPTGSSSLTQQKQQ